MAVIHEFDRTVAREVGDRSEVIGLFKIPGS
jgi:hypothetical protein